jgi:Ras-related protein Rab-18
MQSTHQNAEFIREIEYPNEHLLLSDDTRSLETIRCSYLLKVIKIQHKLLFRFNELIANTLNSQHQNIYTIELLALENKIHHSQEFLALPKIFLFSHKCLMKELFTIFNKMLNSAEKYYGLGNKLKNIVFENSKISPRVCCSYIKKIQKDDNQLKQLDNMLSDWFIEFDLYLIEIVEKFIRDKSSADKELDQCVQNPSLFFTEKNLSTNLHDNAINVLLLGDREVGKSNIMAVYNGKPFSESLAATVGFSFQYKKLNMAADTVMMRVWDNGMCLSSPTIKSLVSRFKYDAVFFVCDVSNPKSAEHLINWLALYEKYCIHDNAVKIMVGNKIDLPQSEHSVLLPQLEAVAEKYGCLTDLVSAKTGEGIEDLFKTTLQLISVFHRELKDNEASQGQVAYAKENTVPVCFLI